jgi:hypothetical protein
MNKRSKRPRSPFKDERSTDLHLWIRDGAGGGCNARLHADMELSIGRTNSMRGMGFVVGVADDLRQLNWTRHDDKQMSFVLDRDQCAELIAYLRAQLKGLRRPIGRRTDSFWFSSMTDPHFRLNCELQQAAMEAHPGWKRDLDFADERDHNNSENWICDPGAPDGIKLIKWFERTHPHKAKRIEREFSKRLWAGRL